MPVAEERNKIMILPGVVQELVFYDCAKIICPRKFSAYNLLTRCQ